jgi:release factor glutamine methyltransferase
MQKEKINKVIDIINWGDKFFSDKGVSESKLNIELLLCSILKCKRLHLYLNFDKPLNRNELDILSNYVIRRSNREPIQYIVGETEFMGFPFKVDRSVLIPRPETEILVESVVTFTKKNIKENYSILDIGTGSGNIAVSFAKLIPNCKITALDCSEAALSIAKLNSKINLVAENVEFLLFNILQNDTSLLQNFDIIVSNPPYISYEEYEGLEPEIFFEPKDALTDYQDGFLFYERILELGKNKLNQNGLLAVEVGYQQGEKVNSMFKQNGFEVEIIKDYAHIERVVLGVKR